MPLEGAGWPGGAEGYLLGRRPGNAPLGKKYLSIYRSIDGFAVELALPRPTASALHGNAPRAMEIYGRVQMADSRIFIQ